MQYNHKSTSIVCAKDIKSNPPANITWINPNGTEVKENGRYSLKNGPDTIELNITNISSSDNGTWMCTILVQSDNDIIGKEEIAIDYVVSEFDSTETSRHFLIKIVITVVLGLIVCVAIYDHRANKPSGLSNSQECITEPENDTSGSTITQSDISDEIITKPDICANEVTRNSDEVKFNTQSLAELLKEQSTKISHEDAQLGIYQPMPVVKYNDDKVSKCIVTVHPNESVNNFQTQINEKVLMLVGATGAGKSTLINGIVNYIMSVQWQDTFRFKLICDGEKKSQAHSQTSKITAYSFPTSCLSYTLTVIDTPGFGDTRGMENDKVIMEQIKTLFSCGGPSSVDQIDGVGFVVQASSPRLTPTMKYIFDSVLSIFGNDIASNIFLLITFADNKTPPVLSAVKAANIPYCADFRFNNSALYSNETNDEFSETFWKLGSTTFEHFFTEFEKVEPHSLSLTRETLSERQQLEAIFEGVKKQIKFIIAKIEMLRQKQQILHRREAEILRNQHFSEEITIVEQRQVKLPNNVFVTNCRQCEFTCHFPCPIPENQEKYRCKVMNDSGTGNARCTVCPKKCQWDQHVVAPYRFETYCRVETYTSDDLKKNLSEAIEGKSLVESMITDIEKELVELRGKVVGMVGEAKWSLERLQKIALKPNPLSEIEYIDLLIKAEKSEKSPGFAERIKEFEMIKGIVKDQGAKTSKETSTAYC